MTRTSTRGAPLLLALAIAAGIAAHARSLGGRFVWDDTLLVAGNPSFSGAPGAVRRSLDPRSDRNAFGAEYLPARDLTYFADRWVFGPTPPDGRPTGMHAANLLLHGIAVAAAYALALRLSGRPAAAFAAALLLGVHPALAQDVDLVSGRKDLLAAALGLPALLAWHRGCAPGGRRACRALAALLLALASLSEARAAPGLLAGMALLGSGGRARRLAAPAAAAVAVLAVQVPVALGTGVLRAAGAPAGPDGAALFPAAAAFFPARLLWPFPSRLYEPLAAELVCLALSAAGLAAALALAAAGLRAGVRGPAAFLLALLPLAAASLAGIPPSERYLYVPLALLAALGSGALSRPLLPPLGAVAAAFAVLCGIRAGENGAPLALWRREARAAPLAHRSWLGLGKPLLVLADDRFPGRAGPKERAGRAFRRGIALGRARGAIPEDLAFARCQLAYLRLKSAEEILEPAHRQGLRPGDPRREAAERAADIPLIEAHDLLRDVLATNPGFPEGLRYWGDYHLMAGLPEDAMRAYAALLRVRPGSFEALSGLARACLDAGLWEEAAEFADRLRKEAPGLDPRLFDVSFRGKIEELRAAAVESKPDERAGRNYRRAVLRDTLGDHERAIGYYERVLDDRPDLAGVRYSIAQARLRGARGRREWIEAGIAEAQRFLDGAAEDAPGWTLLGLLRLERGEPAKAVSAFERALRIPDASKGAAADARYGLALAYEKLGRFGDARREAEHALRDFPDAPPAGELRKRMGAWPR